ncbi:hypothetical protein H2200_005064 [Cladophialophora chaetospira]|uniref:Peptidase M20 dimerisation domain-containing protein n=1 Tax=Cladophialophora chaetospira TaxID=386627 RepID=A0AA38XBE5_9EURO|nr:hypothetical protein H2200_005064 [Cladophialophora chaetospira]
MTTKAMSLSFSLLSLLTQCNAQSLPEGHISRPIARQENSSIESIIADSPLLSLHRDLVEISSVSNNEVEVGSFLANYLEQQNFTVTFLNVSVSGNASAGQRRDVFATRDTSDSPQPKVLLTSHIDTVPPFIPYSAAHASNSTARADIRLRGRGTVDAKSCVAAQVTTAIELLDSGNVSASDLALLFVVGEENSGDGMSAFNRSELYASFNETIKGIIFGEPTEGKLATGHKGTASLFISANGTAAHSAYPELGKSAISMILPALAAVDSLDALTPEEGGLPRSAKFGNSTANPGLIEAGTAPNVVPGYASSQTSIRVAGGTPKQFEDAILARIALFAPRTFEQLNITFTYNEGPVDLVGNVTGFEGEVFNYATDIFSIRYRRDVKAYLYGPGSIHVAHGANEYVRLGDLEDSVEGYKRLVADVLGD